MEAVITKDAFTGKWIICRVFGNMIEGDEIARRRGSFATKREAQEALQQMREEAELLSR